MCLMETERVRLWRKITEDDATFTVQEVGGEGTETVIFMDGEMLAPWDTRALPVTDGSVYRITQANGPIDREVKFELLESVSENPEDLATLLIENGCTAQLELLSEATMIAEG